MFRGICAALAGAALICCTLLRGVSVLGNNMEEPGQVLIGFVFLLWIGFKVFTWGKRRIQLWADYRLYKRTVATQGVRTVEALALHIRRPLEEVLLTLQKLREKNILLGLTRDAGPEATDLSAGPDVDAPCSPVEQTGLILCASCGAPHRVQESRNTVCEYCDSSLAKNI